MQIGVRVMENKTRPAQIDIVVRGHANIYRCKVKSSIEYEGEQEASGDERGQE